MGETSPLQKIMNAVGVLSLPRVALFAGVLTGIYYVVLHDSGGTIIQATEAAKSQLESENAKKIETQKVLKKEQQMKADVELLARKFEEIKARIPLDFTESDLRSIVDQYSMKANLKTTRTDRKQITIKVDPDNNGNESLIDQVALSYEFEGSYDNISRFVSEISNLEKLIKIGDFELSARSDGAVSKKNKDLVFKVIIIGFKQAAEKTAAQKGSP